MKPALKLAPTPSFWAALVLGLVLLVPIAIDFVKAAGSIFDLGLLVALYLPFLLLEPAAIIAIIIGVLLRRRLAFYAYMAGIPLATVPALGALYELVFHQEQVGASLGYGAASSLTIAAFLMVLVGVIAALEYIAYLDLQKIPRKSTV